MKIPSESALQLWLAFQRPGKLAIVPGLTRKPKGVDALLKELAEVKLIVIDGSEIVLSFRELTNHPPQSEAELKDWRARLDGCPDGSCKFRFLDLVRDRFLPRTADMIEAWNKWLESEHERMIRWCIECEPSLVWVENGGAS